MNQIVAWILWLGILLPISLDGIFSFEINGYNFRLSYFFCTLTLVYLTYNFYSNRIFKMYLTSEINKPYLKFFAAFCFFGFLALFNSVHLERSIFFWVWTSATVLFVPLLIKTLVYFITLKYAFFSLVVYLVIQETVVIWDFFNCYFRVPGLYIGRVLEKPFCKPYVLYYEPNYIAGFFLIAAALLYALRERMPYRPKITFLLYLTLVSSALTGSRLGMLGAILICSVEFLRIVINRKYRMKHLFQFTALFFIVAIALVPESQQNFRSVLNASSDLSFSTRFQTNMAAFEVFKTHPLVGVGPGTAANYLLLHFPDHQVIDLQQYGQDFRNSPLAHSMFMEVLSEWGLLGFIAFFAGLTLFIYKKIDFMLLIFIICIGLVYGSSQTLPRFDLWFTLSLIHIVQSNREYKELSFEK